jgi:hypothetical protein
MARPRKKLLVERVCNICSALELVALRLAALAVFGYGLYGILRQIL